MLKLCSKAHNRGSRLFALVCAIGLISVGATGCTGEEPEADEEIVEEVGSELVESGPNDLLDGSVIQLPGDPFAGEAEQQQAPQNFGEVADPDPDPWHNPAPDDDDYGNKS